MLPQALEDKFNSLKLGLDIHDPIWGAWWENISHDVGWSSFQKDWEAWFRLRSNPTLNDIIQEATDLAQKYKLDWTYQP